MKELFYIGNVPPPCGGVTVRNFIYIEELKKHYNLSVYKFKHARFIKKYLELFKLIKFIYINSKSSGIICLDTQSLIYISKVIYYIKPNIMKNITIITSGGIEDKIILESGIDISILNKYRQFLVEINTLKDNLTNIGIKNISILPNCRNRPLNRKFFEHINKEVKFISISRICKEKGILKIIEAEKLISKEYNFKIDFFGIPVDNIKNEFLTNTNDSERMEYKGIFKGDKKPLYDLLKLYDVLLLPSDHLGEGYPGVVADAKIAGLAIISSDINDNSIIIKDKIDGVILEQNNPESLAESMKTFILDKTYLYDLRKASYDSAEEVFIDNYIEMLMGEKS